MTSSSATRTLDRTGRKSSSDPADPSPESGLHERLRDEALDILNLRSAEGVKTAMLSYDVIQSVKAGDWSAVLNALDERMRRAMLMLWIAILAFPLAAVMHALVALDLIAGSAEVASTLVVSVLWMGYGAYAIYENVRVVRRLERASSLLDVLHDLDDTGHTQKASHATP